MLPLPPPTVLILAAIWILACMQYNLQQPRLPNTLVLVGFFGAAYLRLWSWNSPQLSPLEAFTILVAWGLAWIFWSLGWWGAGDAKFMMVLLLAFPRMSLLAWVALANVLGAWAFQTDLVHRSLSSIKTFWWQAGVSSAPTAAMPGVTCLGAGWWLWLAARWLG